jgi:beta-glucosidase
MAGPAAGSGPRVPTDRLATDRLATDRLDALIAALRVEEKLALLEGATPFWSGMADIALRDASHRHPWPSGVLPRLGLTGLHFVDGPRGVVLEGGATTFPVPIARGATWDPELEERIGEAIALEARSFGANWAGVVCVNLLRHPGWGRAQETYGEDPVLLGALGAAMTRGVQRHAVACVKHFALNSIDSSRFLVDVRVSSRVLHELYLPHFRDCVEAGAGSVMSAYNRVNGDWCGQNGPLLDGILKRRWGFTGFVVTDFIFGLRDGVAGVAAGLDLEMPFRMILSACLPEAVARGLLPMARIDDALRRQLRAQLGVRQGVYPVALRGCPAHRALAREAATRSIVLLRNEGNLLPLTGLRSLALLGPLAAAVNLGDRGSSDTRPAPGSVLTPLAGLRAAAPELAIHHWGGLETRRAARLAAASDAAVVVVGLDWRHEGEHIHPGDLAPILALMPPPEALGHLLGPARAGRVWSPLAGLLAAVTRYGSARSGGDFAAGDRTDLALPAEQVALILAVAAANPRTVVVLMGGGAILCQEWLEQVNGLLLLWYPGQEGGAALADVLLGRVSPSGRMPFTVPSRAEDLPPFEPRAEQVVYDLWHGYRRLARGGRRAAFPFGFGLSYSRFALSDPQLTLPPGAEFLTLRCTLRNTGPMEAAEVLQVYLEPPGRVVERPMRQLVGFQRVLLAVGEVRSVALTIPLRRLAWFDESRDAFRLEPGRHRLVLARHVEDGGIALEVELADTVLGP